MGIACLLGTRRQRSLSILEQARFVDELLSTHQMTMADVAEMLSRSKFRGPPALREAIDQGRWKWTLDQMQSVPDDPQGVSEDERRLLRELERLLQAMQHVLTRCDSPGRTFSSLEDLNQQARQWATERMEHRVLTKARVIPAQLFEHERLYLHPLPEHLPAPYQTHQRVTDQYGYVAFGANYYWVPGTTREEVKVLQYADCLKIYRHAECLAEYALPPDGPTATASWTWPRSGASPGCASARKNTRFPSRRWMKTPASGPLTRKAI